MDKDSSFWISWQELVTRWGIRSFELFEFIKKGLEPYSSNGIPLNCIPSCHYHRYLADAHSAIIKQIKCLEELPTLVAGIDNILPDSGCKVPIHADEHREKNLEKLLKKKESILKELTRVGEDDPSLVSWKYFKMPSYDEDVDEILKEMEGSLFKKADVRDVEKNQNLKIAKRHTYLQDIKAQVQKRARDHREESPLITIKKLMQCKDIRGIAKFRDDNPIADRTLYNWIREINTGRWQRGQPPKAKK